MGERFNLRWILFGLLALVAASAGIYWWWQNVDAVDNIADAGNMHDGIAAGPHVAHVYADVGSRNLSESWILDGNTCRAKVVVARQIDADASTLTLPAPDAVYPYEIRTRGAFSLLVPDGVRVDAIGAMYTSTRLADWTDPSDLDDNRDLEIARYPYQTGRTVRGGRTVVNTVGLVGVALPWPHGIRGQRRVAVLEIAASPMSRCDGLAPRWEAAYGLDVRATAVPTPRPTPTPNARLCPNHSWYDPHGHRCVPNPTLAPGEEAPTETESGQTPQTLFIGGGASATFAETDFTARVSGISPLTLTLPTNTGAVACDAPNQDRTCRHVALAVPAAVTITSIMRRGAVDQEWCGLVIENCAATTAIIIETLDYQFVSAGPFFTLEELDLEVRWRD